jgi:F-type H+-transporting ATPase subunit alpha
MSILDELKEKLGDWQPSSDAVSVGTIEQVADGIARISDLPHTQAGELLHIQTSDGPITAMALNLEETIIGAIILGDFTKVRAGMTVLGTGTVASVPVGEEMLGRVVNVLGEAVDGKGAVTTKEKYHIEKIAPGVITRRSVNQPLQTGILAIDAMIPIGRGQRQLILGDRGTGKTAIALDTIISQKASGVVSIYVAIGQKESKIAQLRSQLEKADALDTTVIVMASASDPAPMQYLAPYVGCAIGEYFMAQGKDALVIYDDLSKHAAAYREISLLLRRPPGREAYPGDVFYLHSRLLERAARLNDDYGGGSLTALPIIETQAGDISAYIPTNVISITDGQIYLETDLVNQGIRPAINVGLSVSRVGGAAQTKALKKVAGRLRLELAQYRELAAFSQFVSDLDQASKDTIDHGKRLTELLKQSAYSPIPMAEEVALIYAAVNGYFKAVPVEQVSAAGHYLREELANRYPEILKEISEKGELTEENEDALKQRIPEIIDTFKA